MKKSNKKSSQTTVWIISGCVGLVLLGGCIFVAKLLMSDLGPSRKTQISTVNLIPPPPPVVKEKPPGAGTAGEKRKNQRAGDRRRTGETARMMPTNLTKSLQASSSVSTPRGLPEAMRSG